MDAIIAVVKKACVWLERSFRSNFVLFLLFWLLLSVYQVDTYFLAGDFFHGMSLLMALYVCSFCLVLSFEKIGVVGIALKSLLYFILVIFNVVYIYSVFFLNSFRVSNVWMIILNTNVNEAKEFFISNVTIQQMLLIVCFLLLSVVLFVFSLKMKIKNKVVGIVGILFLILSLAVSLCNRQVWHDVFSNRISTPDMVISRNLKEYMTHPKVIVHENNVSKIVLVLGESFAKSHSSLYGYSKNTNPMLKKIVDEENLFVFDNVQSPGVFTAEVFKYILNENTRTSKTKWYESTSIFEVFDVAGYDSYWISNQEKTGFVDNVSSNYSQLCKHVLFNDKKETPYDDFLLKNIVHPENDAIVVYHLYGQHPSFSLRYPDNYGVFNVDDYAPGSESVKKVMSDYDNATLYNDSVVFKIMESYKNDDAVIFYFSDHGMDIFESNPEYAGHAKWGVERSVELGTQIPFMIYVSPVTQQKHPVLVEKIQKNLHRSFNTEDLIYTVMDVANLSFDDNRVVEKSIFRN